ncbi:hypothetical protein [Adlercreutzia equolifaciens]|uniref:hypothetical protein n=1 Tax=Adlercreutzia equolifaciens TaxID=446660 RepID=UPI00399CC23A
MGSSKTRIFGEKQWQYKRYHDLIGEIILENEKKIGYRISRMDFDQLLWYYYKGKGSRLAKSRGSFPRIGVRSREVIS